MTQALEAKFTADTSGFQSSITQAANLTNEQMKRIASYIKTSNDATVNLAKASQKAASDTATAYGTIAANADTVSHAHAGMTRELIVLGHELSQGNLKRFGGSLLVLAEYSPKAQAAISALMGPIGALVGLTAIAGAAMIEGALDAEKFAKSLQLTGNYAALTQTSLQQLAAVQRAQTGQSLSGARESIEAAAGSGAFGTAAVAAAARAMGDYEKVTGEAADAVLGKFKSIQDGVAKWAEEQNKQMHFLTLGEYDRIKALEESGQKEQAAIETLKLLATTMESRATPATGALAATWRFLKESVQDAGAALANVGKPSTLNDHMNDVKRQIGDLQSNNSGGSYEERQRQLVPLQGELARLIALQATEAAKLRDNSLAAQRAMDGISGQKAAEEWIKRGKAVSAYNEAFEKYHADVKQAADGGKAFSPADIKAGDDAIKKQFTDHTTEAAANQYRNLQATIKAFNVTSEEELGQMTKVSEGHRFQIQILEELGKSESKLSAARKTSIAIDAAKAASLRDMADASAALNKSMMAEAEKSAKDSINSFIASQKAMDAFRRSGASRVSDIDFQTSLVGKSPEDQALMQSKRSIDIAASQALEGASGQRLNEILAEQAKQRNDVTAAMARQNAQELALAASFSAGWTTAMSDFAKKAADDAANAKKLFDDVANGLTDAITNFAMTGKLSVKSMVDSIIQDMIRMETQKGVSWLLSAGTNALSGIGGSDSSSGGSALITLGMGVASAAGYANGLDYVPYDGFPAVLHEGERVTSRQDAAMERSGGGGTTVHIDQSGASYGAGVDASGVQQIARAEATRAKSEIVRALATNGRFS